MFILRRSRHPRRPIRQLEGLTNIDAEQSIRIDTLINRYQLTMAIPMAVRDKTYTVDQAMDRENQKIDSTKDLVDLAENMDLTDHEQGLTAAAPTDKDIAFQYAI